jgi:hypothetical protein
MQGYGASTIAKNRTRIWPQYMALTDNYPSIGTAVLHFTGKVFGMHISDSASEDSLYKVTEETVTCRNGTEGLELPDLSAEFSEMFY